MKHLLLLLLIISCGKTVDINSNITESQYKEMHKIAELRTDCYEEVDLQYEGETALIEELKQECIDELQ